MFCRFSRCNNSPAVVSIRPTYKNKYSPIRLVERNLIYFYVLTLRNLNHVINIGTTECLQIIAKYSNDYREH